MSRNLRGAAALFAVLALPVSLEGQDRGGRQGANGAVRVFGTVVDQVTRTPIPFARVSLGRVGVEGDEPIWEGGSDGNGRFRTTRLPLGVFQLKIEVVPYSVLTHLAVFPQDGDVDIRVEMVPVDFALDPVVVSALRETRLMRTGFFDRAASSPGHFVTRGDIEALNPLEASDLFRAIPGVSVTPARLGPGGRIRLRGGCEPQVVLDGTPMTNPVFIDAIAAPSDIEAIEVYHGATSPIQYTSMSTCGTVMMWTRDTGTPQMSTVSMKKFMAAIGFLVVAVVSTQ